ncbi:MAG: YceI family protein [Candidatus Kapaibacteriales bacterium]
MVILMKNLKTTIAAFAAFTFAAFSTNAADIYKANAGESQIKWTASKVSGDHWGYVKLKDGYLEMDGDKLTGGKFNMNMTTIDVQDLEDKEWNGKLQGHLMSDDFFSVDKYKTATLVITDVKKAKGNTYDVNGDLTIKGIKKPVSFPVTLEQKNGNVVGTGKIKVDRTKYDIKYNSGSYFENLGDKMIYDEFNIDVKLVAKK